MKADPRDFACTCTEPHYVYRCYDAADRLVYVGVSRDVEHRMHVHRTHNPEVYNATERWTAAEYPDRAHALAAEAEAIANESPLLNVRHSVCSQKVTPTDDELRAAVSLLGT